MKVNRVLIHDLMRKGKIRELAVLIHFKSQFENQCIYNYTDQKLADITGMSKSSVRSYVKLFLKKRWARMHCGNLVFSTIGNLDMCDKRVIVDVAKNKESYKPIISELTVHFLKHKFEQFEWYKETCHDLKKLQSGSPSDFKKASRVIKKMRKTRPSFNYDGPNSESGGFMFKVSFRKLAKWFKCSVGKAYSIIQSLHSDGLISIKEGKKHSIRLSHKILVDEMIRNFKTGFMTRSGYFCVVESNEYFIR